jgi:hypothetical protein
MQVVVYANRPPSNGTCTTLPQRGVALTTAFNVRCLYFHDLEGHLPLAYQYSVMQPGQVIALATAVNSSSLSVRKDRF